MQKPLVILEVNLGEGKGKHKLAYFEKDSPERVACKFAEKYCLNEAKKGKLEKLLRQKISDHIFKTLSRDTPVSS